jgi:hypothetical protein
MTSAKVHGRSAIDRSPETKAERNCLLHLNSHWVRFCTVCHIRYLPRLRKFPYITVAFGLLLLLGLSSATAQYSTHALTITPYVEAQRFSWEERVNDKRLLQETGMRYYFGAVARLCLIPRAVFFTGIEFAYMTGKVNYDGNLMDGHGDLSSYSATTAYSGADGDLLFGSTLRPSKRFLVTPVAGAGIEYWLRNLDDRGPYGYTEKYVVPSVDCGVRLTYVLESNIQLFSTFLARFPLSISESFTVAPEGQEPYTVTLHPGTNPQYRIGVGLDVYRVFVVFSFESWYLNQSAVSNQYYQPESTRQEYGVRICYSIGV